MKHVVLICSLATVFTISSLVSTTALSEPVRPPPLPPGSERVVLNPGMNPTDKARSIHAHTRPLKDKTRDDTLAPVPAK